MIIERGKPEGEPANHKSIRLFQWRAGVDFFFGPARSRDTRSFVTDREARQIERQVEANDETSGFERRRQKSLVDKIMKTEGGSTQPCFGASAFNVSSSASVTLS